MASLHAELARAQRHCPLEKRDPYRASRQEAQVLRAFPRPERELGSDAVRCDGRVADRGAGDDQEGEKDGSAPHVALDTASWKTGCHSPLGLAKDRTKVLSHWCAPTGVRERSERAQKGGGAGRNCTAVRKNVPAGVYVRSGVCCLVPVVKTPQNRPGPAPEHLTAIVRSTRWPPAH